MIGGNVTAALQTCEAVKNDIGEAVKTWETAEEINGFLDLSTGDSKHVSYDAKIQESTHVFVSDWKPLDAGITAENSRMVIDGKVYEVMLIDDPMGLHEQLEIYLQYRGGQSAG